MYRISAFYHFARIDAPVVARPTLVSLCLAKGVMGTVLLANEGVNGTIAGSETGVAAVLEHIRAWPGFAELEWKDSAADTMPFGRLKVRLKREIVTMGQPDVDPVSRVGRYVDPADWNALISAPDVVVIDTRNGYEVAIGTFEGAIDPETEAFGEFPEWWRANRDRFKSKRVAMFCTGGIRCEKATNWLLGQGVEDVFHLRGGILKYLKEVPQDQSMWRGSCFVFDQRVSVGHGLAVADTRLCHACRHPMVPADLLHPDYEAGVSCHRCADRFTQVQRAGFRERQRQIELAAARGKRHLAASGGR